MGLEVKGCLWDAAEVFYPGLWALVFVFLFCFFAISTAQTSNSFKTLFIISTV